MKISCLMLTYARYRNANWNALRLVEEALECFLRQTYQDRELILINDAPTQKLNFKHPLVHVYNMPNRFNSLGEKRNFAIQVANGDYCTTWDDDDIRLPGTLSQMAELIRSKPGVDYFDDMAYWYSENNSITGKVTTSWPGHYASACYSRKLGLASPYQKVSCGEDQGFFHDLTNRGFKSSTGIYSSDQINYIYRWGYLADHISGRTMDPHQGYKDLGNVSYEPIEYTLQPGWDKDYLIEAREFARKNHV